MTYSRHFHESVRIDTHAATVDMAAFLLRAWETIDNLVVKIVPDADIAQNDTNYVTIELNTADGAGGALSPIMTAVTTKSTGGVDLNDGEVWTPTLTTDTIAAGSYLVLETTTTAGGQDIAGLLVSIEGDWVQS